MKKKITKKSNSKILLLTETDLKKLAHEGTKDAIAKIEAYLKTENDPNKKSFTEMALEECEFFYYQPKNEKEEEDFFLCMLINQKQNYLSDITREINKIHAGLDKFSLEQKVHARVLAKSKKKGDWEYRYMDDFVSFDKKRLIELEDNLVYEKAWISEAKKMIRSARYKNGIPERHLSHFDFGFDDRELGKDLSACDCCNDGYSNCE